MLAFKLAWRNLKGAGLRTWLTVFILSLSFLIIIWYKGIMNGWERQAYRDTINQKIGGGQYFHQKYDPYDPLTLSDAHGVLPEKMVSEIKKGKMAPVLISQATIYPEGRPQSIIIKGIDVSQKILDLPTKFLDTNLEAIPVMIGASIAESNNLKRGDSFTIRWRDANGTFDAADAEVMHIFKTNVPTIDKGQIWIPIKRLQEMLQMPSEATIVITAKEEGMSEDIGSWSFKDHDYLLKDIEDLIKAKSIGGYIMWLFLSALAWLAIFDTQVLSIFRRQKEIGTDIALGMTRAQVVRLFTIEGAMHGVLAAILAAIYGIPLLYLQYVKGYPLPEGTDEYGFAISETIYPYYSIGLIVVTTLLTLISTTIISYLPARRIARMKPTDAIRGKAQ